MHPFQYPAGGDEPGRCEIRSGCPPGGGRLAHGSAQSPAGGYIELELEDEKANPKYGILTVKGYLQKAKFAPETTIELAGVPVGIYE